MMTLRERRRYLEQLDELIALLGPDDVDANPAEEQEAARAELVAERAAWAADVDAQLARHARLAAAVAAIHEGPSCKRCGAVRGAVSLERLEQMLGYVRGGDELEHAQLVALVRPFHVCGACLDGMLEALDELCKPTPQRQAEADAELAVTRDRLAEILAGLERFRVETADVD